jgi:XRE family transcriptional regulator, master regulator for biofilm formation
MLGETIRALRESRGYSISELAKQADISKSYLSQIERGSQKNPSLQFLNKVANSLDISIDHFLGVEVDKNTELDNEWKDLIIRAITEGMKKEDFLEYLNYIKYENWKVQIKNNSPHSIKE